MCHVITLEWKNHLLPFYFFCITQLENNLTSFTLTIFEKDKTYCFFSLCKNNKVSNSNNVLKCVNKMDNIVRYSENAVI